MKQLLNPLIVVVLLVSFSLLQAQPRILSFAFDENVLPDGWWEISTNPQAKWKVGKISSFDESLSPSLNLHHIKGFGDDLSIIHSDSYQLPQTESLWLSMKVECQLKDASSIFRLDLWDGNHWQSVYAAHQFVNNRLWIDISEYNREDFQLKFVYKSNGFMPEFISIDDIEVHTERPQSMAVMNSSNQLDVYPNPFVNELTFSFQSLESQVAKVQVLDLQGRVLYHQLYKAQEGFNEVFIDLGNIAKGRYILSVTYGQHVHHQTISKQ